MSIKQLNKYKKLSEYLSVSKPKGTLTVGTLNFGAHCAHCSYINETEAIRNEAIANKNKI